MLYNIFQLLLKFILDYVELEYIIKVEVRTLLERE
jgi:hypothetical protein